MLKNKAIMRLNFLPILSARYPMMIVPKSLPNPYVFSSNPTFLDVIWKSSTVKGSRKEFIPALKPSIMFRKAIM